MSSTSFKLPANEKNYPEAYEKQERYFNKKKKFGKVLVAIAALIPPLSLLFTLPILWKHYINTGQPKAIMIESSFKSFIFVTLLAAILPVVSGLICSAINDINIQFEKKHAPVQKISCSMETFAKHKQNRAVYKALFDIDTHLVKSAKPRKPSKLVVDKRDGKEIYMDKAQLVRWGRIENNARPPLRYGSAAIIFFEDPFEETSERSLAERYHDQIGKSQRLLLDLPAYNM